MHTALSLKVMTPHGINIYMYRFIWFKKCIEWEDINIQR